MAKNKNDYFKFMAKQIEYCLQASDLLVEMVSDYSVDKLGEQLSKMKEIEHTADSVQHDILTKLYVEFITPIDQEDILRLVHIIEDVTDALDESAQDFYMYHMDKMPDDALEMAKIVNSCVKALQEAVRELKNFKKPVNLRTLIVNVSKLESEADKIYTEAIHNLFRDEKDFKRLVAAKALYEDLEDCCDLCEHAADAMEQIIIKNT